MAISQIYLVSLLVVEHSIGLNNRVQNTFNKTENVTENLVKLNVARHCIFNISFLKTIIVNYCWRGLDSFCYGNIIIIILIELKNYCI
jgi:hypothetical protein